MRPEGRVIDRRMRPAGVLAQPSWCVTRCIDDPEQRTGGRSSRRGQITRDTSRRLQHLEPQYLRPYAIFRTQRCHSRGIEPPHHLVRRARGAPARPRPADVDVCFNGSQNVWVAQRRARLRSSQWFARAAGDPRPQRSAPPVRASPAPTWAAPAAPSQRRQASSGAGSGPRRHLERPATRDRLGVRYAGSGSRERRRQCRPRASS